MGPNMGFSMGSMLVMLGSKMGLLSGPNSCGASMGLTFQLIIISDGPLRWHQSGLVVSSDASVGSWAFLCGVNNLCAGVGFLRVLSQSKNMYVRFICFSKLPVLLVVVCLYVALGGPSFPCKKDL